MRTQTGKAHEYASGVLRVLAEAMPRFAEGWNDTDRSVIHEAIALHNANPDRHQGHLVEVILDNAGNWRLKASREDPKRVRLADYRMSRIGQQEDPAVSAVNLALAAL